MPPPRPERSASGVIAVLVVVLLFLAAAGVGGYFMVRNNGDDEPVAHDSTEHNTENTDSTGIDAAPEVPASGVPSPAASSSVAAPDTESTPQEKRQQVTFTDSFADTRFRNRRDEPEVSGSADIGNVHVFRPDDDGVGWVVVELAETSPGATAVLQLELDGDQSTPDLVAWRHTTTGASSSFEWLRDGWGHGRDLEERSGESDPRLDAGDAQQPVPGVAFPLRFASGELPEGELRFNIQVFNDDLYYDYFPRRHTWKSVRFEVTE